MFGFCFIYIYLNGKTNNVLYNSSESFAGISFRNHNKNIPSMQIQIQYLIKVSPYTTNILLIQQYVMQLTPLFSDKWQMLNYICLVLCRVFLKTVLVVGHMDAGETVMEVAPTYLCGRLRVPV